MKQNTSFLLMSFPLAVFVILGIFLFVERTGAIYGQGVVTLKLLESTDLPKSSTYKENPSSDCLILYNQPEDGNNANFQTVIGTLDNIRIKCDLIDAGLQDSKYDLKKYQKVVVITSEGLGLTEQQLGDLVQWVSTGGRVLFSNRLTNSAALQAYIHELGIRSLTPDSYVTSDGVTFTSDFMPGVNGVSLPAANIGLHESLPVTLEKTARVHMTSADDKQVPLLWEEDYEKGRFVVINTNQLDEKTARGTIAAAYSLLNEVFVYPVINSSLFFIDDFPSPIPEGENEDIKKEYQLDNRNFFQRIWWPDMYALAENFGLKYTGVLVETYNHNVEPPFEQYNNTDDFRYYGSLLFKNGGQLGLHGYNHVPLCMEKDWANQFYDYPAWPSVDMMKASLGELLGFGQLLYPGKTFSVYVPPSNVLCPDMRQELPKVLPDLKVISSLYMYGEVEGISYVQEFEEADDGIVELPRISSGFWMKDSDKWAIINELSLHYVNSHFVHPDDIFDDARSANNDWKGLYTDFEKYVQWLEASAPGLRQMTAIDGAAAVQRFARLKINTRMEQDSYIVSLDNFYDEAWLMLRSSKKPTKISGGTVTQVTSTLYLIHAVEPEVKLDY